MHLSARQIVGFMDKSTEAEKMLLSEWNAVSWPSRGVHVGSRLFRAWSAQKAVLLSMDPSSPPKASFTGSKYDSGEQTR